MGLLNSPRWKERWVMSYIFDYAIVILMILGFSALDYAEPFHQRFSLNNESLQYPFAEHERITPLWAGVISCLFPLACMVVWTMFVDGMFSHHKPPTNRSRIMAGPWTLGDRLWEMNCAILGLGLSVAGAICITGALKNATGKPRPDVISRCWPDRKIPDGVANGVMWGLVTSEHCTQGKHAILKDGFRSWPSGHSSTAFAGLGYLSLFLAGKLHIMDNRGEVWKTVIVLIPLLAASLVAVSRIMDARHHPFDVITGSMLGMGTAWVAYRQYFPPISEPAHKGRAYPRRTWGVDTLELPANYASFYPDPRGLEEGNNGSSDSIDSITGARKRTNPQTSPFGHESYEMQRQRLQRAQTAGSAEPSTPPLPPPHGHLPQSSGTNPFDQDVGYRGSVDMGDTGGHHPQDSPTGRQLGLGQLSPPPTQIERI